MVKMFGYNPRRSALRQAQCKLNKFMTNEHFTYMLLCDQKTFYLGITDNLKRRILEHKSKLDPKSFTARYNCDTLLYYNGFHSIEEAINEEKRLKAGSRKQKLDLIFSMNPLWKDLYNAIED